MLEFKLTTPIIIETPQDGGSIEYDTLYLQAPTIKDRDITGVIRAVFYNTLLSLPQQENNTKKIEVSSEDNKIEANNKDDDQWSSIEMLFGTIQDQVKLNGAFDALITQRAFVDEECKKKFNKNYLEQISLEDYPKLQFQYIKGFFSSFAIKI
jgi:hypothetical protein